MRFFATLFAFSFSLLIVFPSAAYADLPTPPGGTTGEDFIAVCKDWLNAHPGVDKDLVGPAPSIRTQCEAAVNSNDGAANFNGQTLNALCFAGVSAAVVPIMIDIGAVDIPDLQFDVALSPEGRNACNKVCTYLPDALQVVDTVYDIASAGALGQLNNTVKCIDNPVIGPAVEQGAITPDSIKKLCQDFVFTQQNDQVRDATADVLETVTGGGVDIDTTSDDDRENQILVGHGDKSLTDECGELLSENVELPRDTLEILCRDVVSGWGENDQPREGGGTFNYAVDESPETYDACRRICNANSGVYVHCETDFNVGFTSAPSNFQPPEPGLNIENINKLSGGFTFYALVAAIIGICVSAALWAMGSKGQNPGTELTGKKGLIVCCAAAFFIGAVPAWINYLDGIAKSADENGVTSVCVPIRNEGVNRDDTIKNRSENLKDSNEVVTVEHERCEPPAGNTNGAAAKSLRDGADGPEPLDDAAGDAARQMQDSSAVPPATAPPRSGGVRGGQEPAS